MKNKILAIAAVLLFACSCSAVTEYDAETFYKSALTYFQINDFRNTLRSVHLAKEIFGDLERQDGVVKCNQLITQVDEILTDSQMASAYYDIAGEYYLQENPTLSSYIKAKEFAEYAKEYYNRAGDGEGLLRSEDLINRARSEINNIQAQREQEAYAYYKTAQSLFLSDDYLNARTYAINASILYNEILSQSGISQTASLIVSIDFRINETKYNALASYDRARDYYVQKEYESALKYAIISQQLSIKIADKDGEAKASNLISTINTEYTQNNEQKLRLAQTYVDRAREMLIAKEYANATDYAKRARDIYSGFYAKAEEKEHDLPSSQQVETALYSSYLKTVDNLMISINSAWGSEKKKEQAEAFYTKSQEYYIQGQLDPALTYVERARSYFTDLNDYIGVNKCDALIVSIKNRMVEKRQADDDYTMALSLYHTAEFENSLLYLNKAKAIYVRILDKPSIEKAENLTASINDGIKMRGEAEVYYQQATRYFNTGDYKNAKEYSEKAYMLYSQINHTLGITSSLDVVSKSSSELEAASTQLRNNVLIAAAIIIIGGYLIVSKLREQKAVVKELEVKKQRIDEETRLKEAEWAVRRDEETKEKVEEELRKLIEQERGGPAAEQESKPQAGAGKKESSVEDELRKLIEEERKQEGGNSGGK
ncbi:MAG: hypothetical protein FJY77_04790 [Candidatus Altiarchaeales archaeon]|nr:hypothetical protein [Candidatus Altiarchaeales archaeon]